MTPTPFEQVLHEMHALHEKKNSDYGNAWHEEFKEFGAICGVMRLYEKVNRLKSIYKKGYTDVKDESLDDTLIDIANYAVMTLAELREARKNEDAQEHAGQSPASITPRELLDRQVIV